jgi:hypothetical protein
MYPIRRLREEQGRWVTTIVAPGPGVSGGSAPRELDVIILPGGAGRITVTAMERVEMKLCAPTNCRNGRVSEGFGGAKAAQAQEAAKHVVSEAAGGVEGAEGRAAPVADWVPTLDRDTLVSWRDGTSGEGPHASPAVDRD